MDVLQPNITQVLAQNPLGLILDIDGTLSPIAPTPDQARLHPDALPLLEKGKELAHTAILSGRAVDNASAMVNIEGLTYIGTHGLEWSEGLPSTHSVQIAPEVLAYIEPGKRLLDMAEQALADLPGILVERKRVGGSIHFRLCPDLEQARARILSLLAEPVQQANMLLSEGKRVIEIKSSYPVDKGRAMRRFVEHYGLRGAAFAGDDRTDIDAMVELKKLRTEGSATLAIAVQHTDTPSALLEAADVVVQGVDEMIILLHQMIDFLSKRSG